MNEELEPTWSWSRYFTQVTGFFENIERQSHANPNRNYTEYVIESLEVLWRSLNSVKEYIASQSVSEENQAAVRELLANLEELINLLPPIASQWQKRVEQLDHQSVHTRYQAPSLMSGHPGRPRFDISKEQLEYLYSLSFSWTDIAQMLGVSRMTIYRRRVEYSMMSEPLNSVSDSTLHDLVQELRREMPDIGQSMVCGRLRALGIKVNRERVREAVRQTDPLITALRWNAVTPRRPYTVAGPNSLWHIGRLVLITIVVVTCI